ncbi:MAG: sirohydrochlorin cobaltochelatase [Eubacteriales bacterium]|nr:sirohydrochlorin cobaltochelatase [Eubacteriales bacterium]
MGQDRMAVLVVSFGTSHPDTREKTIDAIESRIAEALEAVEPGCRMYRAWTSGMIIRRLRERDGCQIDTVEEAMRRMIADGVTRVIVQPTHIINGIENDWMKRDVQKLADRFACVRFGVPLLTDEADSERVIRGLMEEFSGLEPDTALVFMGHGTAHYANAIYAALDYQFKDMGYEHVFVGTVEAYPSLETLKKKIRAGGYRRVILTPLMIVAGEHAKCDMAGDEEDSWKCQLEREGLEVTCVVKGLGEYEFIRQIFADHGKAAAEKSNEED